MIMSNRTMLDNVAIAFWKHGWNGTMTRPGLDFLLGLGWPEPLGKVVTLHWLQKFWHSTQTCNLNEQCCFNFYVHLYWTNKYNIHFWNKLTNVFANFAKISNIMDCMLWFTIYYIQQVFTENVLLSWWSMLNTFPLSIFMTLCRTIWLICGWHGFTRMLTFSCAISTL